MNATLHRCFTVVIFISILITIVLVKHQAHAQDINGECGPSPVEKLKNVAKMLGM